MFINKEDDKKCRHCSMVFGDEGGMNFERTTPVIEDSSDSEEDTETELSKSFHARLSSNLDIKCSVCLCE